MTTRESEALPFHRLWRGSPGYRWWKPLVFGILAIIFGFTLSTAVSLFAFIPMMAGGSIEELAELSEKVLVIDTQEPLLLFTQLASIVVWIPAIFLAAWAVGLKPVGRLFSVTFRLRLSLLGLTLGPALVSLLFMQGASILYGMVTLPADQAGAEPTVASGFDPTTALISVGIILLFVPLQAAAEEFMFRGAMMQVLGAWIKNPVIPILAPTVLFAFAHLYDPWALLQVAAIGVTAAWLSWRTGGLEAAISIHTVNNLFVFLLLSSGVTGETAQQNETGSDWVALLVQVLSLALYAWLVLWIFRRRGFDRLSSEPQQHAPYPAASYPAAPFAAPSGPLPQQAIGAPQSQPDAYPVPEGVQPPSPEPRTPLRDPEQQ